MDGVVFPVGVMCSLGLAGVALSFVAILQARSSVRRIERRAQTQQTHLETAVEATKVTINGLANEIQEIQHQGPVLARIPRSGFNLSTRSQALRMNRRGDSPDRIAAALQVPLQEVELLLKVNQIVLKNLIVTAAPRATPGRPNSNLADGAGSEVQNGAGLIEGFLTPAAKPR